MASLLDSVKPLLDRGTSILSNVPGPAGQLAKRLGSAPEPQPRTGTSDQALAAKVESALYRLPGVARSRVTVTVADGTVTVRGVARDQAQQAGIETAVRSVPGVKGLESEVQVPEAPASSTPKTGQRKAKKKKKAAAKAKSAKDTS
jgi:hypothetical protein